MKKIVISGSIKLKDEINYWLNYFKDRNYEVIDYPILVEKENYLEDLSNVYKSFYQNLEKTDIYFLMNEDKNGIKGYIGASGMCELAYVVILNLIHNKNIDIYILNMPSKEVSCYDEIEFYLNMGWIKIYDKNNSDI